MRKLDFIVQTMLLGLAALAILSGIVIDKGFFVWVMFVQFFTGIWQLLSALLTVADNSHGSAYRTKTIRSYWLMVAIYFVVLALLSLLTTNLFAMIWFSLAWLIAVYYYVFTINLAFKRITERKTFMDIVS